MGRGTRPSSEAAARLAAFGAVALWGISFVATKAALRELSPVTLIFSRFAMGTAVLFLMVRLRKERLVPPRDAWPALTLMGFVLLQEPVAASSVLGGCLVLAGVFTVQQA